jgi:hypothetical protein
MDAERNAPYKKKKNPQPPKATAGSLGEADRHIDYRGKHRDFLHRADATW